MVAGSCISLWMFGNGVRALKELVATAAAPAFAKSGAIQQFVQPVASYLKPWVQRFYGDVTIKITTTDILLCAVLMAIIYLGRTITNQQAARTEGTAAPAAAAAKGAKANTARSTTGGKPTDKEN